MRGWAKTPLVVAFAAFSATVAGFGPSSGGITHGRGTCRRAGLVRLNAADGSGFEGRIAEFAPRQELPQVRGQLAKLGEELDEAISNEEYIVAAMIRDDLAELRSKDPAVMAAALRDEMQQHARRERYSDAARCRDELLVLRRYLPQYQLAGLWKGSPEPALASAPGLHRRLMSTPLHACGNQVLVRPSCAHLDGSCEPWPVVLNTLPQETIPTTAMSLSVSTTMAISS